MYKETKEQKYIDPTIQFCKEVVDPNIFPKHTPKGMAYWSERGSLRYAANGAFICLQVRKIDSKTLYYSRKILSAKKKNP